jgi:hypothetical protein
MRASPMFPRLKLMTHPRTRRFLISERSHVGVLQELIAASTSSSVISMEQVYEAFIAPQLEVFDRSGC